MAKELSDVEVDALDRGECPDCGVKALQEGPCAGVSMNVRCSVCKARFNLIPGSPGRYGKERLEEPQPSDEQLRESKVLGPAMEYAESIEDDNLEGHDHIVALLCKLWRLEVR